jgi:hypothetical protein
MNLVVLRWTILRFPACWSGDEPCSPALDHFELIDFAFIVDVIYMVFLFQTVRPKYLASSNDWSG